MTNTSYLIEAGSRRAVLRINNPHAHKLGVCRRSEITILKKLQSTDFVPRFYFANNSILVTEYIDGHALDAETALKPEIKKKIEQNLAVIQSFEFTDIDPLNYESYLREYCEQLSQKDFDVAILLNQVIPIELKNSVKFGNPKPPVSFGEKINFCGNILLLPPFTKFTKNFSISLSSFFCGGGITAAKCVNLDSKQVLAILTLPKCDVLIPAHL